MERRGITDQAGLRALIVTGRHPNSLANLRPPEMGEVRNPEGRNQYTYRREFEQAFSALSTGQLGAAEFATLDLPQPLAAALHDLYPDGMSRGALLAHVIYWKALSGDSRSQAELLARLLPKVEGREHEGTLSVTGDPGALLDRLARLAAAKPEREHQS